MTSSKSSIEVQDMDILPYELRYKVMKHYLDLIHQRVISMMRVLDHIGLLTTRQLGNDFVNKWLEIRNDILAFASIPANMNDMMLGSICLHDKLKAFAVWLIEKRSRYDVNFATLKKALSMFESNDFYRKQKMVHHLIPRSDPYLFEQYWNKLVAFAEGEKEKPSGVLALLNIEAKNGEGTVKINLLSRLQENAFDIIVHSFINFPALVWSERLFDNILNHDEMCSMTCQQVQNYICERLGLTYNS